MNIRHWIWFLGAVIPAVTGNASELAHFRYLRELAWKSEQQEELLAVELDSEIYRIIASDFSDLRVFQVDGAEQPYFLQMASEPSERFERRLINGQIVALRELADGIEIDVRLPNSAPSIEGLSLQTSLRNFERRVTILGLPENDEPKLLVSDSLIFDYSRYADISNQSLSLPKNEYRAFRLVIKEVNDTQVSNLTELTKKFRAGEESERIEKTILERRTLRVEQVTFWGLERQALKINKQTTYPTFAFRTELDNPTKETRVFFQMNHEPLTQLTIETPNHNFRRSVILQQPIQRETVTEWQTIAPATIFDYSLPGYSQSSLTVTVPEQRGGMYRLVIQNENNPPLQITGLQATGPSYQVVFLADQRQAYRLAYGSDGALSPNYDTSAIQLALDRGLQTRPASLAKPTENPAYTVAVPKRKLLTGIFSSPLLFGFVVVLMVLILGWGLFQVSRRLPSI